MTGPAKRTASRRWTDHDTALWYACDIDDKLRTGRRAELPRVAMPFAMKIGGRQEQILASGSFQLADWTAVGNGQYDRNSGFFIGAGAPALAVGAVFLGANAIGNSVRKNRARRDMEPRWVWRRNGDVHVGTHGFYLQSPAGLNPWGWHALDAVQVAAPATLWIQGQSTGGPASWLLRTIWAELAFLLWTRDRNPHHPQLSAHSWLPDGWARWARTQGRIPGIER